MSTVNKELTEKINLFFEEPNQFTNKTKFIKKHISKYSLINAVKNYEKVFLSI